jgi:dipeptidyl aminopeptidase/acylaminoacyl peptidase
MALEREAQQSTLHRLPLTESGAPGQSTRLTEGPFDATPSVSPDGRSIAFAAPVRGRDDTDLYAIDADGANRRVLIDDSLGDETGPAWSVDGRWLFATSVVRSMVSGEPLMAVLVCADLRDKPAVLRALHDPAGVTARLGVTLAPRAFDASRLRQNPRHRDAWDRILKQELDRQEREE